MKIHVVSAGETVADIARRYGVSPQLLARQNQLPPSGELAVGQALVVLFPTQTHLVLPGDSLFSIARRYGVTVRRLLRNNYFLLGMSHLTPGEELVISLPQEGPGTLAVSGYAYPMISQAVLAQQLPYLTHLIPFTYGVTAEGGLTPLRDDILLAAARRYGVTAWMSLSTLTEGGQFSTEQARRLLTDPHARAMLIQKTEDTVRAKGYRGVDVDFEYLPAELARPYADFVAALRARLAPLDCPVTVAAAPKTDGSQPGLLYEGHDYAALGEAADQVLLMTYEWGYTYSEPMAVAPLPQVEQVLAYALSVIPAEKLFLGMPTYGYDWTLPAVAGQTRAASLSPQMALALAVRYGVPIQYDERAQAPWFRYRVGEQEHEVWFEDARSARVKLELAAQKGVRGVGLWNLMRLFPQLCLLLGAGYGAE